MAVVSQSVQSVLLQTAVVAAQSVGGPSVAFCILLQVLLCSLLRLLVILCGIWLLATLLWCLLAHLLNRLWHSLVSRLLLLLLWLWHRALTILLLPLLPCLLYVLLWCLPRWLLLAMAWLFCGTLLRLLYWLLLWCLLATLWWLLPQDLGLLLL